jgi:hypothetical protein
LSEATTRIATRRKGANNPVLFLLGGGGFGYSRWRR